MIGTRLPQLSAAEYQSWDKTDPAALFDAPTLKAEANPKARVCRHLQAEARGCDYLVLWLDCDREGENICFGAHGPAAAAAGARRQACSSQQSPAAQSHR